MTYRVYLDHETSDGMLDLCASLDDDGNLVSVEAWEGDLSTGRWVPLPDDLGVDLQDLAEKACEHADLAVRNWP